LYRFGFNGQENDLETGMQNYKYRMYDPSIARFFAVDPLVKKYPWNSPYAFCENRVIDGTELEGAERIDYKDDRVDGVTVQATATRSNDPSFNPRNPTPSTTVETYNNNVDAAGNIVRAPNPATTTAANSGARVATAMQRVATANPASQGLASVSGGTNPQPGNDNTFNIPIGNQFNQGMRINDVVAGAPSNTDPTFSTSVAAEIQNPTTTNLMANNTSRVLILTNGTVASINNAINEVAILQNQFPNVQFAIGTSNAVTQNPASAITNNDVVAVFNPTQNVVAGARLTGWTQMFTTPMIPQAPVRNSVNRR